MTYGYRKYSAHSINKALRVHIIFRAQTMWVTINKALWVQINIQNPQKVSDHHQSSICIDNIQSSHSVSKHPQSSIGTDNIQSSNSMSNHQQSPLGINNIQNPHTVSYHQSLMNTDNSKSPTINKTLWEQIIFRAQCE